jgi:hypothetical protein
MRLRNPGQVEQTIRVLEDCQDRLMNYRGQKDPTWYLAWCEEASRRFREEFTSPKLAELAEQDQRDLALGGAVMTRPREFLDRMLDLWHMRLAEAVARLEALRPFIERPGQIIVIDTSAFIEGTYFTDLDWRELPGVAPKGPVRLITPIVVIDELDHLKPDKRAGSRARSVLRRLLELQSTTLLEPAPLPGRHGVTIEVFLDGPSHQRLPDNDAEIIDRATYIAELTGRSVLLTAGDYGILYRAAAANLAAALVPRHQQTETG